jgi:hypothetical protein
MWRWGIALLAVLASPAHGQGVSDDPAPVAELDPTWARRSPTPAEGGQTAPAVTEDLLRQDAEVREAFRAALVARYQRERGILEERAGVIAWTNLASIIIFWVVHAVLAAALWAALVEFRHASRTRKGGLQAPQEIRVSLEGVALKTTLHGLMLLAIAFGFYFLYLKFVYPITTPG